MRPYGVKMMVEILRDEEMFAQSSRDTTLAEVGPWDCSSPPLPAPHHPTLPQIPQPHPFPHLHPHSGSGRGGDGV